MYICVCVASCVYRYGIALRGVATIEQLDESWMAAIDWNEQALPILTECLGRGHPLHARTLQSIGES